LKSNNNNVPKARQSDPPLIVNSMLQSFFELSLATLKGTSLKHYEDKLGAILCAYLSAYFWAWSYDRKEMIGNHETGYIINPKTMNETITSACRRTRQSDDADACRELRK
jgi:predicted RNase H-like nuclease